MFGDYVSDQTQGVRGPAVGRRAVLVGGLALATAIATPAIGATDMSWGGYSNGMIPISALKKLSWTSQHLYPPAADTIEQLNRSLLATFGTPIGVTDSYRDYARQVATKRAKGSYAATPGKSNHG